MNGGLYIKVNTEADLIAALEKTLDCPMITQIPCRQFGRIDSEDQVHERWIRG
jgi:hypothetical protein